MKKRKKCQLYIVKEPQFKAKSLPGNDREKPSVISAETQRIEFSYEDGPRNCEAMSVCPEDLSFWFIEKVYVDGKRKSPAGIYKLPNPIAAQEKQANGAMNGTAIRIADFPVRNVTGWRFRRMENGLSCATTLVRGCSKKPMGNHGKKR